jgi:polyisoprenoid-binding protein YceI
MSRRRTWSIVGGIAGVVVVAAVAGPLVYASLEADAAPPPTVQVQPQDVVLTAETDGTWTVGPNSSAGYRVDEVLNGADVTVAGKTQEVSGSAVVAGGDLTGAEVTVDVASITTDRSQRDAYFRSNVMEVDEHPTATFAVDDPVDLPELTGTPVTVPVSGDLTVAGVTRPVRTEISVVRTAAGVDVSGSVPVTFADYGLEAPDLGFVRVEDHGSVEFLVHLVR